MALNFKKLEYKFKNGNASSAFPFLSTGEQDKKD